MIINQLNINTEISKSNNLYCHSFIGNNFYRNLKSSNQKDLKVLPLNVLPLVPLS